MTWSDKRRTTAGGPRASAGRRRWLPALATLASLATLGTFGLAGCGGREPSGFDLAASVRAREFAVGRDRGAPGLSFARPPALGRRTFARESRAAVVTSVEPWVWRGRVPPGAELHVGAQAEPLAWAVARSLEVTIEVADDDGSEVLAVGRIGHSAEPRWLDLDADLSAWAGKTVAITVTPRLAGLLAEDRSGPLVVWGPVGVASAGERARDERPNVLVILIDTLRADHLTPYGYPRDTSPEIARRLGARGARFETAYSQAPWTLPSLVGIMSGRSPGKLLGDDLSSFGLPPGVPTLAERFARLGYATGAFIANPALHEGNGFARGFSSFYTPEAVFQSMNLHGDALTARVFPWLAAHRRRPFFLYVHYIDPHDPYDSPDDANGYLFDPGYTGKIGPDWIHGIYNGRIQLDDPARDLEHIRALYDSEIHFVDREVGRLLDALPEDVLRDTLVVLTADHGEELFEHGGWKHGQTLYDEQIHVPLFFRWDGRIAPGRAIPGVVRLLDLAPTLIHAVGGESDPAWDGVDLLPTLLGQTGVPRKPAFAEHLSHGPLRSAVVLDRAKLIWFDREQRFAPADGLQEHLWKVDVGRLRPTEFYDLEADPGEKANLATARPEAARALAPALEAHLDERFRGLRIAVPSASSSCPAGSHLGGSIAFEHSLESVLPLFFDPGDRVEIENGALRFDVVCGPRPKTIVVRGDLGGVASIAARRDGSPLPAAEIRLGAGAPYAGGRVGAATLVADRFPLGAGAERAGALWIWRRAAAGPRTERPSAETEKSLKALGYVQ